MSDNNDLTPEERALRGLDNEPKQSSEEKQGLDDLENAVNEEPKVTSLGKVERTDYTKESVEQTELKHGFFAVDVTDFPSKGRFYPRGTKV